jgi:hypothetical protein
MALQTQDIRFSRAFADGSPIIRMPPFGLEGQGDADAARGLLAGRAKVFDNNLLGWR